MNPINIMSLSDLDFFLDKRLSEYNVYQFIIITPFIDDVLVDVIFLMRKYSCNQLIQEIGADYVKLTFVSHVKCKWFYKYLTSVCRHVATIHKLPLFNII